MRPFIFSPLGIDSFTPGILIIQLSEGQVVDEALLALVQNLCHQTALFLKSLPDSPLSSDSSALPPDITQLQKMASIGNMVGGIAHDFNNIMSVIIPNVELIQHFAEGQVQTSDNTDQGPAEKNREIEKRVDIIKEMSSRGADLTRQLLMFSQNRPTDHHPIDVNNLLSRMVDIFQRTFGGGIRIAANFGKNVPLILGDRTQLTQVMVNLAINARDALKGQGQIIFSSGFSENKVYITVSDDGPGIPSEQQNQIFDPFFSTKRDVGGTGLGLSISRSIVKSHRGDIRLQQTKKGCTFILTFPVIPPAATKETTQPKEKILVVDSNRNAAIPDSLSALGYQVATVSNEAEALEILQQEQDIQLAIVDLAGTKPPQKLNAIETIKRNRQQLKILLANGEDLTVKSLTSRNIIQGVLTHPHQMANLRQTVRNILSSGNRAKP